MVIDLAHTISIFLLDVRKLAVECYLNPEVQVSVVLFIRLH